MGLLDPLEGGGTGGWEGPEVGALGLVADDSFVCIASEALSALEPFAGSPFLPAPESLADALLEEAEGTGRGLDRGADFEKPGVETFFFAVGAGLGSAPGAFAEAFDVPTGLLIGKGRGGLWPLALSLSEVRGPPCLPLSPCSLVLFLTRRPSGAGADDDEDGGFIGPSCSASASPS